MGTNYYLVRREPTIREAVHIGKRSWGWRFHWDSCDEADWPRWCDTDHTLPRPELPHGIHSVEDVRAYLRTGEWELVDEYGEAHPDWEAEIEGFCAWDGGRANWNERHPDEPVTWEIQTPSGYRDGELQVFDRGDGFI